MPIKTDLRLARRIGERLRKLRHERGWTQSHVARLLGVDTVSVSRYEGGTRLPGLVTLVDMTELLEVGLDDLVGIHSPLDVEIPASRAAQLIRSMNGERANLALRLLETMVDTPTIGDS